MIDTCSGARLASNILTERLELRYIIAVLCDSYGLQLLIKDLLSLELFKNVFTSIIKLVIFFRTSKLQLLRLRAYIIEEN